MSHHIMFTVLFSLSALKLVPGPMGNRWMAGGLLLAVLGLCLWQAVRNRVRLQRHVAEHWTFWALLLAASALTLVSCLVNFDWAMEQEWPRSAILMVSALSSYAFFLLAIVLFWMTYSEKMRFLPLVVIAVVGGLGLLELVHGDAARLLLQHTLRAPNLNSRTISSVFPVTTDFGPWSALAALFFWVRFLMAAARTRRRRAFDLGLACLCSIGVLIAGSRSGLLGLGTGLVVLALLFRQRVSVKMVAATALVLVLGLGVAFTHNPYVQRKIGTVIPAVQKFARDKPVGWHDLYPADLNRALSKRLEYWKQGLAMWRSSPWLGIGLGQFNVRSDFSWKNNVNNLYLNILIECGVVVFLLCMILLAMAVRHYWRHPFAVILISLAVMAIFDNLYDHLLPWNLTVAWVAVTAIRFFENKPEQEAGNSS